MDNQDTFSRWAIVEMFGKKGETYEQVVRRISAERIPNPSALQGWSFVPLDWSEILDPPEPLPAPPRYRWKDPKVKNTIRKPRKPRTNVSRETSRSVSEVETKMEDVPVKTAGDEGKPIVASRADAMAAFTKRQEELAMKILLGKE